MIDLLTWALVALVVVQPDIDRFYLAVVFATLTQIHNSFMSGLDGLAYFGSAALFDLLILSAAAAMPKISGFTMRIGLICMVSIVLNTLGAILWALYHSPWAYNYAYILLYTWAIWVFIKRDQADVGKSAMGRWLARVCGHPDASRSPFNKHEGSL